MTTYEKINEDLENIIDIIKNDIIEIKNVDN